MDEDKDDLDSLASSFSMVSFGGEEVSADVAVDQSMGDTQKSINNIHVGIRNMLTSDERGEDYEVLKGQYDEIDGLVKIAIELMRDIRAIAKQLVPPKPRAKKSETTK